MSSSTYATPVPETQSRSLPALTVARQLASTLNDGKVKLPDLDRARAKGFVTHGHVTPANETHSGNQTRRATSFAVTDNAVTFTANVGIGNPPTQYTLIVDTGSSNTWVGAGKAYVNTKTSVNTKQSVNVNYGSGKFSGIEYNDTVTLAPGLVAVNQSIGVASSASGFTNADGILGLGPAALTQGSLANSPNTIIPTVTDRLLATKNISTEVLGIYFAPTTSRSSASGELTFGGVDSAKYTGSITYAPITKTSPSKFYWGIDQSVVYGSGSTSILPSGSGIVDTGTTLVLLPSDAFKRYTAATGATADTSTGLLTISSANYAKLQSMFFTIGGTKFEFTANAQTWPRTLNTYIGGSSSNIYLIIGDIGYNSGTTGLDFINGFTFLERFYSVFDTTNSRVGIATTSNTKATTN